MRGEKPAAQRLEALLQAAYGKAWTTPLKNRLLETVGSKSLDLWLRDKFFEQHCKLFQHRPFIWHVWDGLKDGFSALVNYRQLDKTGLERRFTPTWMIGSASRKKARMMVPIFVWQLRKT